MKDFTIYINEKLKITKDILKQYKYNYYPKTKDELKELVERLIEERGNEADLNDIDTSEITDMSELFKKSNFNGDISEWNVGKVENMAFMFRNSQFNGDISKWDVRNVRSMSGMFAYSKFNMDISNWERHPKSVTYDMFFSCPIEAKYKPKFNK
jgi:surface protein